MNKLIITLAALTAITLSAPVAQAGVDCDEDSISACVRQFIPNKAWSGSMPSAPRASEAPTAAQPTPPAAAAPAPKTVETPAKLGGPAELCKKYFANIGRMIDVRCD